MTKYPILHTKFGTAKINKKGHLIEWFNKNYPTEPLHIELNGGCNND